VKKLHSCRYAVIDAEFKTRSGALVSSVHCPKCGKMIDPLEVAALAVSSLRSAGRLLRSDAKKTGSRSQTRRAHGFHAP
jgi:hypothetical protein